MDIKRYEKSKFWFLENDRMTKKEPKNGDNYFRYEWRSKPKFPFFGKKIVRYVLIDDIWVERPD